MNDKRRKHGLAQAPATRSTLQAPIRNNISSSMTAGPPTPVDKRVIAMGGGGHQSRHQCRLASEIATNHSTVLSGRHTLWHATGAHKTVDAVLDRATGPPSESYMHCSSTPRHITRRGGKANTRAGGVRVCVLVPLNWRHWQICLGIGKVERRVEITAAIRRLEARVRVWETLVCSVHAPCTEPSACTTA
jgi:hypothetical protein